MLVCLTLINLSNILLRCVLTIRIVFVFGQILVPVILIWPSNKIYYSVQSYSKGNNMKFWH